MVNVGFLKREPDVKIGSTITMNIDDQLSTWQVVGVATMPLFNYRSSVPDQAALYANFHPFTLAINDVGATNRLLVVTTQHDPAFQAKVAQALESAYDLAREQPMVQTRTTLYQRATSLISGVVLLLLVMVCVFIVVAGLSLSGAMSLNVLDRTKEIGVLRAIGSSSAQVVWLVLMEGVYSGILSWLLALVIALPLGKIMSDTLGWNLVDWPLQYIFPPSAALIWLLIVVILAIGASYLPAANAARMSVRDVLVHE